MIYQISEVKTKTIPLTSISEGLIKARRIQSRVKERIADGLLPKNKWKTWSSIKIGLTSSPSRWIE